MRKKSEVIEREEVVIRFSAIQVMGCNLQELSF